ncbi:MAG: VCBS domain-containing protein, partial [Mariniphaga sp.]
AEAQELDFTAVRAGVHFDDKLREWDGFGFNYVETAHTYDYDEFAQEYGGFSLFNEQQKQEIVNHVFGKDGLKVGLVKMFLGANHQLEPYGPYNHERTTEHMRYFVREGLKLTRQRGDDLQIITTLYGPPGFMTKQKIDRGRDLDPKFREELAKYMIDWVKFLKEKEGFPVKYLSLHNEGEDWYRWNQEGHTDYAGHDYNLYWPHEQVVEYINMLPPMLKEAGVGDVGVTPGENTNWYRFYYWGYARAIYEDADAVNNLGLITTHGFYSGNYGRWFGEHNSLTNDLLRSKRPELHSWVTSTSWSNMDAKNIKEMHGNIYTSKVNGIIPWAGIQRPPHWVKGDPNPGSAFTVHEDGSYDVRKGYYFYKQITRAGQPGMAVAYTYAMDSEIAVIGFAKNGTKNHDAFVVTNITDKEKTVAVEIRGSNSKTFEAYRTTDAKGQPEDRYKSLGDFQVENNRLVYKAPPGSVTTFYGK